MSLGLSIGSNPLSYTGVQPATPPALIVVNREPTLNDWQNFTIGTFWLYPAPTPQLWVLLSLAGNKASAGPQGHWVQIDGLSTPVTAQTFFAFLPATLAGIVANQTITLGAAATPMQIIYADGNNVTPGNGAGTPLVFTANTKGRYNLQMNVTIIYADTIAEFTLGITTSSTNYFYTLNSALSTNGAFSVIANLNQGDLVIFSILSTNVTGAYTLEGGVVATPTTWVCGNLIQ